MDALNALYGSGPAGKTDFNNSSPQSLADKLITADPLQLASKGSEAADRSYHELADALINFKNNPPQSGLITDFQQLRAVTGVTPSAINFLNNNFYMSSYAIRDTQVVGPKVGARSPPPGALCNPGGAGRNACLHLVSF